MADEPDVSATLRSLDEQDTLTMNLIIANAEARGYARGRADADADDARVTTIARRVWSFVCSCEAEFDSLEAFDAHYKAFHAAHAETPED